MDVNDGVNNTEWESLVKIQKKNAEGAMDYVGVEFKQAALVFLEKHKAVISIMDATGA